jgi:hypothetical protein
MNKQRVTHALGFLLTVFLGGLTEYLKASPWALAPAAGAIATALLVDLRKVFGGGPPSPPAVVALLAAFLSFGSFGCWLTKPTPITPSVPDGGFADASAGTTFVDCAKDDVHQAGLALVADVMTDLALGPALALPALEALLAVQATKLGGGLALGALSCAVQWAVVEAQSHLARGQDSIEATKVRNGRAWLTAHPVSFITAAP